MDLVVRVRELVVSKVESLGFEAVEVKLWGSGRNFLKVLIHKPGGASLGDCALVSRSLSDLLDTEDPLPGPYILEVSSPGLDRPLTKPADFERNIGKEVKVVLHRPYDGRQVWCGRVAYAVPAGLLLDVENKETLLPWEEIARANLEVKI